MKLPASERKKRHWQTAAEMVLMAAENRGPMMQAHIGMLQALNPTPETTPKRKPKRNTGSTGRDTKPM
jgi:hypothetical protein